MNLFVRRLILILWVVALTTENVNGCPVQCSCSSATNGRTVQCQTKELQSIPLNLPNDTYRLYINSNSISVIHAGAFINMPLLDLIQISYNKVSKIENNAFDESSGLEKL
ncbi:leucine-rich repeat-containing protein 3-like [Mytilus galloprovincialis]|uniref:leucine-rich repeat-containing protein 3-like n=1 Tax=Mytilus galloprovincialis TaxID=29158 RepID=UPI003F7BB407